MVGSVLVGCLLGVAIAAATLATGGVRGEDPAFAALWRRASDPYLQAGITAWEFARGKLRGDPVYRAILQQGTLASGGTLVDLGCGGGLALSAIREAVRSGQAFTNRFDRLIGVELRERTANVARRALGPDVLIINADVRAYDLPSCSTVLLLDVLHMLSKADQEQVLERIAGRLNPGGVLVVREADAAARAGFMTVRAGNRLKALVTGNWRQRFAFRAAGEWTELLERLGLKVESRGAADGTPFANVLLVGRRPAMQATLNERTDARNARRAIPPVTGRRIGYSSPR
jgi:SAM-dependent methyltransferase